MKDYSEISKLFCAAVRKLAEKPENLDNMEFYLSRHFGEWMKKYADNPESLTAEICGFANMDI